MTDWSATFLPRDGQLFPRTMGEFLASMVRHRWPTHTAKNVAKAWDLDETTAKNLTKGHASERTITKALAAEGWPLLESLGYALTGQTHHEWEEQRLQRIIDEAEHAQEGIRRLRARRALLVEGALDDDEARHLDDAAASSRSRRKTG